MFADQQWCLNTNTTLTPEEKANLDNPDIEFLAKFIKGKLRRMLRNQKKKEKQRQKRQEKAAWTAALEEASTFNRCARIDPSSICTPLACFPVFFSFTQNPSQSLAHTHTHGGAQPN